MSGAAIQTVRTATAPKDHCLIPLFPATGRRRPPTPRMYTAPPLALLHRLPASWWPSAGTPPKPSAELQLHPAAMAVNSPVYSHGCKSPLPVAERVAGKPGCKPLGRKPYFRYSSQGCRWMTLLRPALAPTPDSALKPASNGAHLFLMDADIHRRYRACMAVNGGGKVGRAGGRLPSNGTTVAYCDDPLDTTHCTVQGGGRRAKLRALGDWICRIFAAR